MVEGMTSIAYALYYTSCVFTVHYDHKFSVECFRWEYSKAEGMVG